MGTQIYPSAKGKSMTVTKPPAAQGGSFRVGDLDLNRIGYRATVPDPLTPQFEALAELQQQGLIRHLGLSTVSLDQLAGAQQIAPVVCVQNFYNIANRVDEGVLAAAAEQRIAFVPYF